MTRVNQNVAYNLGLLVLALAVAVVVALVQPLFLTPQNLTNVALQSVPLVIFSVAQMIPMLTRGLDLSQGGIVVAVSVASALMADRLGTTPAMFLAAGMGLLCGGLNGGLIAGLRISPFIVTLGLGSILQGLALIMANGQPISAVPADFAAPYYGVLLGYPAPIIVAAATVLTMWILLDRSLVGRRIRAVGSSERAAYLSGIPVRTTLVIAYAVSGALTGIGAVLLSSRIASGHPTAGSDTALQAVAAAVVGGVSLFGGRGSLFGAVAGAMFLSVVANALNLLNVSSFTQLVITGIIIILAVTVDRFRHGIGDRSTGGLS